MHLQRPSNPWTMIWRESASISCLVSLGHKPQTAMPTKNPAKHCEAVACNQLPYACQRQGLEDDWRQEGATHELMTRPHVPPPYVRAPHAGREQQQGCVIQLTACPVTDAAQYDTHTRPCRVSAALCSLAQGPCCEHRDVLLSSKCAELSAGYQSRCHGCYDAPRFSQE